MNFDELKKKIEAEQIGSTRMTDVKAGTYRIDITGENPALVSEKGEKIPVTVRALASLRITSNKDEAVKLATTKEARTSDYITNLQSALKQDSASFTENTKFTVAHRLRIWDNVQSKYVYRNEYYNGYPAYVSRSREIQAMPEDQRGAQYTIASDILRSTGVKAGTLDTVDTIQHMPVFVVSQ